MLPEGFKIDETLPEGFVVDAVPEGFKVDEKQTPPSKGMPPPTVQQPRTFAGDNPNLYGFTRGAIVETIKDIAKMPPWFKYIDPSEVERFKGLTGYGDDAKWYQPKTKKQAQVRELLLADLEFAVLANFKPMVEGASPVLKELLPKTHKFLTKARGAKKPTAKFLGYDEPPGKTPYPLYNIEGGPRHGSTVTAPTLKELNIAIPKTPEKPVTTILKKYDPVKRPVKKVDTPQTEAVKKVTVALKEAKPIRAKQEAIYTAERGAKLEKSLKAGEKVKGEAGYYGELRELKGKMTRVQFESIRDKIGQTEIDALFNQVKSNPVLTNWEKLPARRGLAKLFGEYGGEVPTINELELLKEVFGKDFVKAALDKRSMWKKIKQGGIEFINIPRSIMSSFDLSAPLRQGVFLVGRPKQWGPAFKDMFKYFVSEKSYQGLMQNIKARPTYKLMEESRLSLTGMGELTAREEVFMSNWAEKIPVIGRGVKASSRAYTGFLNRLRADVFDDIIKNGKKLGIKDPKFVKDTARFVNAATGRGSLGGLEDSAVALNSFFFSPRLVTSRLQMLNPEFYINLHPQARKEALKSLFTFGATATTVAGLAKLGGLEVGADPRSADFMKVKKGNTRYDILGGFQQPIRLAAQLMTGEVISSTTGKTLTLGEGYKPLTRSQIIGRFFEYKEAPVFSFAHGLLRGRTSLGEKFDVPTEIANRFTPMAAQDFVDLYNEEGLEGVPLATPAIFGVGAQTYGGVQTFGLKGKDYPKLNAELSRLKIAMGFPSTAVFGIELTNPEYKALKKQTGLEITKALTKVISEPSYKKSTDFLQKKQIGMIVDSIKEKVKYQMFPEKKREGMLKNYKEEIDPSSSVPDGFVID